MTNIDAPQEEAPIANHRTVVIADHHKNIFVCQVLDRVTGEVQKMSLTSRRAVLEPFLRGLEGPIVVYIEACRSWEWVSDMCDDLEVDFRLIDPRQMPEIAKSKKKTDQNDVEAMVRRFHVEGGLPEAFAANRTQREFRGLTRTLSTLRGRNRVLLNRIHAEIDSHGLPSKKTEFCKAAWREKMQATLSPDSWLILEADLKQVDLLVTIRVDLQKRATELAGQIRNYARLLTIPGVGPVLASIILAETPHILSFKSARTFAAYCGLVPAVRSSAGKARCGRITKSGPRDLRWALGHAVLVGQFSSASLMYKRKKAQKKPWKAALCAGANKLARVVWSMLVHGTDYQVQVEKV